MAGKNRAKNSVFIDKTGETLATTSAINAVNDALTSHLDELTSHIDDDDNPHEVKAEQIEYDNTESELATTTVQGAIDEVNADLASHKEDYMQFKNDSTLESAKIEKELNDYKATLAGMNPNQEPKQKVNGYGIVSLPQNASNGQVSNVVLKGNTYTNLVRNGNFANGATDWTTVGGSIAINDGVATLTGNGSYNFVYANQNVGAFKANHKYYLACRLKPVSNKITLLQISLTPSGGSSSLFIQRASFEYGAWNFISSVVTSSVEQLGDILVRPRFNFSSAEDAVNQTGEIDDVMVIDLTAIFGVGNEPTKEQCDKIFPHWFDGTKSTLSAMRLKSVGKNLWDDIKGLNASNYENVDSYNYLELKLKPNTYYTICLKDDFDLNSLPLTEQGNYALRVNNIKTTDPTKTVINVTSSTRIKNTITIQTNSDGSFYISTFQMNQEKLSLLQNAIMLNEGATSLPYEPYTEGTQYIIAKDSEGKIVELRSLPNGTKDEVRVSDGKLIKKIKEYVLQASDITQVYTIPSQVNYVWIKKPLDFMYYGSTDSNGDQAFNLEGYKHYVYGSGYNNLENIGCIGSSGHIDYFYLITSKEMTTLEQARAELVGKALTYQLATPIEIPIQTSGSLVSYPSGTVYIEPYVADAGIYTDKMSVLYEDLPIKTLEKISKIDFVTGLETELDITAAVIAEDKLSFTHPDLTSGDIVFFVYEHGAEGTIPETEISYYDSRYVIKGEDDKFYQWEIEAKLVEGVITPSIKLVEV